MTLSRDDVLEAIAEQVSSYEISARGLESATDAVMALLAKPKVLWRGHTEATPDNGSKLMLLLAVDPGTRVAVIEDGES